MGFCRQTPLYNRNMILRPGWVSRVERVGAMIRSAKALLLIVSLGVLAFGQAPAETPKASDSKSGAYYNFTMGRIYAELAQAYGNKPEYLKKAVQFYQDALKLDPKAGQIFEELTE